jgi:hypothetical protein
VFDHARHDHADPFARVDFRMIGQQRLDAPPATGSASSDRGRSEPIAPVIGVPSRSASITKVSLARMSAATTARRRESM